MAEICSCSLPTIQKWRSGEVKTAGSAMTLMRLLHLKAEGDIDKLRSLLSEISCDVLLPKPVVPSNGELQEIGKSVDHMMDRLELMLANKRQEKILLESEARYRSMVEGYPYPICRWNSDTTITYANSKYEAIFGKGEGSLVGKKWIDLIPRFRQREVLTLVHDMVRRGKGQTYQHEVIDNGGKIVYYEWQDFPVSDSNGVVLEFHSVGKDLSELKLTTLELTQCETVLSALMDSDGTSALLVDRRLRVLENHLQKFKSFKINKNLKEIFDKETELDFLKHFRRLRKGFFNYRLSWEGDEYNVRVSLINPERDGIYLIQFYTPLVTDQSDQSLEDGKITPEELLRDLCLRLEADRANVFFFDKTQREMTHAWQWFPPSGESHWDAGKTLPVDLYPWFNGRILEENWVVIEDTAQMAQKARAEQYYYQKLNIKSVIASPICRKDKVIGYLNVDYFKGPRLWSDQEKQAIQSCIERLVQLAPK